MALNIFVSYSTKDLHRVADLQSQLRGTPISVYVAQDSMPSGAEVSSAIRDAISQCDLFVLLWSENARASEWVLQEVGHARALNKSILPIVLTEGARLPESLSNLNFISVAAQPSDAMRLARDQIYAEYEKKRDYLAAQAREQEEKDNLAKLAVAGFLLWVFTR